MSNGEARTLSRNRLILLLLAFFATALAVGCGSDESSSGEATGTTDAAITAEACAPEALDPYKDEVLTVGTERPAFPPYFENDDPINGKGFESALAYAIADRLGFGRSSVEWTAVPFNSSFAPGPKRFDFELNQISITPQREEVVDFSIPYYSAAQAVLVPKESELEESTSLEQFKDAKIGVRDGSTSLDAVNDRIDPGEEPTVFETSQKLVSALKDGQVDAVVVDLPTAIFLRDSELPGSTVVGQFEAPGGDEWGALLAEDSELTGCVDFALQNMIDDGTLEEITRQWMSDVAEAPDLS